MQRFFGKRKDEVPAPSLEHTAKRLEDRGGNLQAKVKKLDAELLDIKKKMAVAKGAAKNGLKRKAMDILKRKKMYERQLEQMSQQQFNIDQQSFAMESMKDTIDTVATMKSTSKQMKKTFKKINIDKIEDMQDDLADLLEDHNEVQEVMGRALGMDALDDLDEDALDEELAALDEAGFEELEDEDDADYLKTSNLPSVPNSEPSENEKTEGQPAVPISMP